MTKLSKRIKLLERQKRVAVIARREALSVLAAAQASETRSLKLAQRSRELAASSGVSKRGTIGAELHDRTRFAASLAGIAKDAQRASVQSAQERDKAAQSLAAQDQRLDRLDEHLSDAKREANLHAELRDNTDGAMLARKLLHRSQSPSNSSDQDLQT